MNLENIKTVDICYENCEVFSIPIENVMRLFIDGIKENLYIISHSKGINKVSESTSITINKDANNELYMWLEKDRKPFERTLSFRDIVSIGFKYNNATQEEIYVNWKGNDEYDNPSQEAYIDKDGNLVINIGKFS